jgi:hypothetical protein
VLEVENLMAGARVCQIVDRPVDALWQTLSDYRGWRDWLRNVADSEMEDGLVTGPSYPGLVRRVGPTNNPRAREELRALDADLYSLTYAVVGGTLPFPARTYSATVRLIGLTESAGTVVDWSARYDVDQDKADDVSGPLRGRYRDFITWLSEASA